MTTPTDNDDPTHPRADDPVLLDEKLTMGIDPFERNWMRVSALILAAFFATVTVAGFAMGIQPIGEDIEVDPETVTETGPFAEPGLREIRPGVYEAWVLAQTWAFIPRELEVPVGSEVTIHVTSPDLQHGFKVTDTNINMQIVPGQVSTMTYTFDDVGEFPYICHEYCGRGHAVMAGVVRVVPASSATDAATDAEENS